MHNTTLAALVLLAAFASSAQAQPPAGSAGAGTSAISGIPPGPASVGGINNSVSDPSGIGNAARAPSPGVGGAIAPVQVPQGGVAFSRSRPVHLSRINGRRLTEAQQEAVIKDRDRLLSQKLRSICTGC